MEKTSGRGKEKQREIKMGRKQEKLVFFVPTNFQASFLPLVGLPLAIPLPEKLKKRKERTHQSRDPEGCTYQSSDPEGYTYQSSDPEGCTYQSSDPEGYIYLLNCESDWMRVLRSGQLEIGATTSDSLRAFDDGDASRLGGVRRPALLQRGG
ncbi:NBS-LRR type resistance protein [Cucumis melo var. makuwa]|uniref:NBS-LRR type resistance protein n=1 Tax=Cucumis melo var. makuwa TaxID=1194695 RepID=A0A5A7UEH0_CUCMM|nr:NBS-LRR type resistance protein [Cucumis melo var. makuwa]